MVLKGDGAVEARKQGPSREGRGFGEGRGCACTEACVWNIRPAGSEVDSVGQNQRVPLPGRQRGCRV